jgi:hypothetical protein
MQGFLPLIFSSVIHHDHNNSELSQFHKSLQICLGIETDQVNGFLKLISAGSWTPRKFEYYRFSRQIRRQMLKCQMSMRALNGVD